MAKGPKKRRPGRMKKMGMNDDFNDQRHEQRENKNFPITAVPVPKGKDISVKVPPNYKGPPKGPVYK